MRLSSLRLHTVILSLCLVILVARVIDTVLPVISSEVPAGWDTAGHFYLFNKALDLFSQGRISGYTMDWYAGVPLFKLYPPFGYFYYAIPSIVTFGLIERTISFTLMMALYPFVLFGAFSFAFRKLFSLKLSLAGAFIFFLSLFGGKLHAHAGIGLSGLVELGLLNAMVGLLFLLLFFGSIRRALEGGDKKWVLISVATLTAIVLTHIPTTLFAFFSLLFLPEPYEKHRVKLVAVVAFSAVVLSSFWWIPFLSYLPYSSASKMKILQDPLFVLLPGLNLGQLLDYRTWFEYFPVLFSFPPFQSFEVDLPRIVAAFPARAFLFLIGGIVGIRFCFRQKLYGLLALFVISLLFLPRTYFFEQLELSIHYYRFIQPIYFIWIALVSLGLLKLFSEDGDSSSLSKVLRPSVLLLALFVTIRGPILQYKLYDDVVSPNEEFEVVVEKQKQGEIVKNVLSRLKTLPADSIVLIEAPTSSARIHGSPHYLSSLVPLESEVRTMPGLLAESSLSSAFIMPPFRLLSSSLTWGDRDLLRSPLFVSQRSTSMLWRLNHFGVDAIVASSRNFKESLGIIERMNPKRVALKGLTRWFEEGPFLVYKLDNPAREIEPLLCKPWAYIRKGGPTSFSEMAKQWYHSVALLGCPLIEGENIDSLKSHVSGFIIDLPKGTILSDEEMDDWKKFEVPFLFLNGESENPDNLSGRFAFHKYHFLGKDTASKRGGVKVELPYEPFLRAKIQQAEQGKVEVMKNEDERIEVRSDIPFLVRRSFAPGWRAEGGDLYRGTPSFMVVIPDDTNISVSFR